MKTCTAWFAVLAFLFLASVSPLQAKTDSAATEIVILHTNDMHAKIDNMGKLAAFADEIRKTHKYVFLVAAGDNFTGNPVVDMVADPGYPMIDLMNRCGFNLSAIGNHEFDLGQQGLNARMRQALFPFVSCNIDTGATALKQPKPYVLLKAGKIRIPVLGVTQLGRTGAPDSHPSKLQGLKFVDGIAAAKNYRWLKKKYGMLVGLTHLGVEGDEPLAQAMPEFDVIIGGHSHTTMTRPMLVNGVMIVQTGSGLKNVGVTTLTIRQGAITDKTYRLVSLDSLAESRPDIQARINAYNDNEELNREIGYAEAPLQGEHELGSLMTDALINRLHLDFAFQNTGGIRIASLPAGKIMLKDVYRLDPFGNMIVRYALNPAEIKSLICGSYKTGGRPDLEVAGMTYTILTDAGGACKDVEMRDSAGQPLAADKDYTVGINSYIAASYAFDHRDPGTTTYTTGAQALIDYLGEVKRINYAGVQRVGVRLAE